MAQVTQGRYPADALSYFEQISAIPRGSGDERAMALHLLDFAAAHGLEAYRDEVHNVYINKPGSPGCEHLPPVVLQGHTDMVCEKNRDVVHDFRKDPLRLRLEGDVLRAEGTTLGADNGVAVAYMMALLARRDLVHPPLECLFTSMEEIGLVGSMRLDPARIRGRRMINLDAGPEGEFLASAAGGQTLKVILPIRREKLRAQGLCLKIRGLMGGHSGADIDKERGNANKLMARLLFGLHRRGVKFCLASVEGGSKSNAIPRECDCAISLSPPDLEKTLEILKAQSADIREELRFSDPGFRLETEAVSMENPMDAESALRLTRLLYLMPNGRRTVSMAIPGLVTSSLNLGVVRTGEGEAELTITVRGASDSLIPAITGEIDALAGLLGAEVSGDKPFAAWAYDENSPLRAACLSLYRETTGREGMVKATHGGVECGIIRGKIPDMDIVALGPDSGEHHTPSEWLDLGSFARTCDFLVALLRRLAEG
jgi:dipeptidase D